MIADNINRLAPSKMLYSDGPLEGMNSRIKMKHRRGARRTGLELPNAYYVLRPKDLTG
jgi:hypothetical protein